ncbi:MAG: hypothetical protein B7Y62_08660 [Sphingomonadales bacterium 35-56-22]|jgi:uncharacterized protein (DUF885 family)|uniref:DUF885 domain-containing protein n=1 Tax=Sphingorhabdus sp. TaxID=1902408 RepID=UPI000BC52004|nr:DUF885 domain-containing protein [Sphingorhabdus sp.]OYY14927.1 MAG: hypothetical protein B7Y62_08660 [Sphingomonadales bacterium 35-56-22]OYY97252.1 MAG: hypothetical protein B7Y38_07865 [Sphingomonadales bacterium 28-56-43]OYZ60057.1 MAG: hypothetical protein B7Y10_08430 [Sphingomonadales bacterium 24-56-14]OZA82335.1 MAG: hypothetical protein B7X66_08785 [Sphingomonadales bacterium 39-57-19]HQS12807.1 DUF885 domain-containing protein [Sphingorhabdus sp.]
MRITQTALSALAVALVYMATPAIAQTAGAAPVASAEVDQNAAIMAFFDEYDAQQLARSPLGKSYRGIKDSDYGKWDDGSDAAEARNYEAERSALKEMRARFDPAKLSPENKLSYRLFEKRAARSEGAYKYNDYGYIFDQMNGAQSQIPAFLINIHRIDTKSDARAYVNRLYGIGPAMTEAVGQAKTRAAKGIMPPKWVYPYVIADSRNVITGAPFDGGPDAPLFADFKAKVGKLKITQIEKDILVADAAQALTGAVKPAYEALIAEMTAQEKVAGTDDGIWRFPDGAGYYAERLANYTTTNMTPDQIHELGLAQVARIHEEMGVVQKKMGVKGDLQAYFNYMRTEPKFYAPETAEGRALYLSETQKAQDLITPLLPKWFGVLPKARLVVKPVEAFREKSAGKAFYQRPGPDGSRPGTYYANLYKMADMPLTEVEALFYHEGVPGHHLQLAIQTELKDVPAFRQFGGVTAYSEGWGLYSEKLAKDMGLYTDPARDFGRLQLELHRAIRLVVDTGLHHKRWTREQAIKYVEDNSADAPGGIVKAIERYIIYPGQATAYMIGRLKISELRDKAQKALGKKFDVRGFHDTVLKSGPVPLDILEEQVDAWIASRK